MFACVVVAIFIAASVALSTMWRIGRWGSLFWRGGCTKSSADARGLRRRKEGGARPQESRGLDEDRRTHIGRQPLAEKLLVLPSESLMPPDRRRAARRIAAERQQPVNCVTSCGRRRCTTNLVGRSDGSSLSFSRGAGRAFDWLVHLWESGRSGRVRLLAIARASTACAADGKETDIRLVCFPALSMSTCRRDRAGSGLEGFDF